MSLLYIRIMKPIQIDFDNRNKRLVGIDVAKAVAIVFVVLTHTALFMPAYRLWAGLAVPSFFMIAGFANARKMTLEETEHCFAWWARADLIKYFTRVSLPYLVMCLAEVIVLPLVKYASIDIVFLNTIKGGMGPGGYFLVCFAQLFLVFPLLWHAYKRKPILTFAVVLAIQLTVSLLFGLVFIPKWQLAAEIYKFVGVKYLLVTLAGIVLFDHFSRIQWWVFVVTALLGLALGLVMEFVPEGFAWDKAKTIDDLQLALYTFGVVGGLIVFTSNIRYRHKHNPLSVFADSTLHILLFQQVYFCCIGDRPKHIALDAFVALIGGVCFYLAWYWVAKLIKYLISKDRLKKEPTKQV